jgi:polyribonucleotide 5'-hydroxyl-kinase
MREYILIHYDLDNQRNKSLLNNQLGPKILITGSKNCGELSFCHMLINYSLRLGWTPIYCDLDLDNEISIPGSIAATVIDSTITNDFLIDNSVILYNGTKNENINYYLYESQICEMARICNCKLQYDLTEHKRKLNINDDDNSNSNNNTLNAFVNCELPTLFASGMIVKCPLIEINSKDKNIYQTIIKEFDIDYVYVIDNERLKNDISNFCKGNTNITKKVHVMLLSKLNGCEQDIQNIERERMNNYFQGPFQNFKINEIKVDLSQYKLLQVTSSNVSSSILPIGKSSDLKLVIRQYNIDDENLMNRIVAIISLDEQIINELDLYFEKKSVNTYVDILSKATVLYFAEIKKVDTKSNTITICGPCVELPHKYLIIGDLKYSHY